MMTRRNLLQRAICAMAAVAFPRNLCRAADALNPVIEVVIDAEVGRKYLQGQHIGEIR